MASDSDARHRHSTRLAGYDYASTGAYFVTLVSAGRECLFGDVNTGVLKLTPIGEVVKDEWLRTGEIRAEAELDLFVVMPNHVHGIIVIADPNGVGAHGRAPLRTPGVEPNLVRRPRTLGSLIAGFKSATTKRINILRDSPGVPVWQRNYYDRIIRNEAELNRIRQYIIDNPRNWDVDPENPTMATEPSAVTLLP